MGSAVEARSVATLSDYASNPPDKPNERARPFAGPLVLYIIRVPGSQDVFLTPQKPRDKIVSAEDVNSCLYYLHINQPTDQGRLDAAISGGLLSPDGDDQARPAASRQPSPVPTLALLPEIVPLEEIVAPVVSPSMPAPAATLHRTPSTLPTRKQIVADLENRRPPSIEPPPRHPGRLSHQMGRHSMIEPGRPTGLDAHRQPPPQPEPAGPAKSLSILRRKPVSGPAPPLARADQNRQSVSGLAPEPPQHGQTRQPMLDPAPATRQHHPTGQTVPAGQITTLTLVRRIPYSENQWNVAVISDPFGRPATPATNGPRTALSSQKVRHMPMYIDILSPGYRRFPPGPATPSDAPFQTPEGSTLHRRLSPDISYLPSAIGFTSKSADGPGSIFKSRHLRAGSADLSSITRPDEEKRYQRLQYAELPAAPRNSGRVCYSFISPWASRCEILDGLTGNSFRCRHASPALARYAGPKGPATVQVSELRFDLPGAGYRPKPGLDRHSRSISDGESRPLDHSHDHALDIDGRTLGKERAGGGSGGKKAKLGKLIIEGEGLDMLDLAVAANLGLWWRVYSKQHDR